MARMALQLNRKSNVINQLKHQPAIEAMKTIKDATEFLKETSEASRSAAEPKYLHQTCSENRGRVLNSGLLLGDRKTAQGLHPVSIEGSGIFVATTVFLPKRVCQIPDVLPATMHTEVCRIDDMQDHEACKLIAKELVSPMLQNQNFPGSTTTTTQTHQKK